MSPRVASLICGDEGATETSVFKLQALLPMRSPDVAAMLNEWSEPDRGGIDKAEHCDAVRRLVRRIADRVVEVSSAMSFRSRTAVSSALKQNLFGSTSSLGDPSNVDLAAGSSDERPIGVGGLGPAQSDLSSV